MKGKVRLYHFVSEEFGISNIENKRIKVSLFKDMNDPFELLAHNCQSEKDRKAFNLYKDLISKSTGIICFSKSFRSPVQWAHYADRHKGMCLGFDVPVDFANDVRYIKGRIKFKNLDFSDNAAIDAFMRKLTQSKHDSWSYEVESRVWGTLGKPNANGLYFQPFDENIALKEVIVGARSTISRSKVEQLLSPFHGGVRAFKVRPAFRTFEMVHNKDESAWK